eukprot:gene7127-9726_t
MSAFNAGANCFLNSPYKVNTIGPNPSTARGNGIHINIHPTKPLLVYTSGKYVIVKNLLDPNDCFIYRGHSVNATVAKFSPNGYWVASGDSSGKVRVWSWDNPEHLTKLETPVFAGYIFDLDWDSESKKIVAVGDGQDILMKCFTWDTGNSVGEMVGHNKRVLSVSYKPSRPFRIMTGSEDFRTLFFAGPPFKLDHSNPTHSNFVNCVRYSSDGTKIVSVGSDKKIQLYDGAKGEVTLDKVDAHTGSIYSVSFSPDGSKFATSSADKTLKIWDSASLTLEQTFELSPDAQIHDAQLAVLWSASVGLVSVSLNGNINVFDLSTTTPSKVIQAHQVGISSLFIDNNSQITYTGSIDGVIVSRNIITGETKRLVGTDKRSITCSVHSNKVIGIASVGGTVYSAGWDDKLRFADASTGVFHSEVTLNGQPCSLVSSPNSDLVLIVTNSEISLFRGADKVGFLSNGSYSYTPTCGAILGDIEIAVGGSDNKTHIYSITDFNIVEIAVVETRSAVSALAYSPQGDTLAIGDAGRQVEVYERGSWAPKVKGKWAFHTSKITALAWSPNGSLLASGALDENIFIWNYNQPASKLQLSFTHMSGVSGISWFDEESFISVGNDHVTVKWKIPNGAV